MEEVGVEEAEEVVDWEEAAHEVESEGTPEAAEATKAAAAVCRGASLLESREAEDWEAEERAVSETKAASWEVETVVA